MTDEDQGWEIDDGDHDPDDEPDYDCRDLDDDYDPEPDWDAIEYCRLSEMSPFGRALYEASAMIRRRTWRVRMKVSARRWRKPAPDEFPFADEPPF